MIRGAGRVRRCAKCDVLNNLRHTTVCPECGRTCGGGDDDRLTVDDVRRAGFYGLYPLPPDPDPVLPGRVMDGRQLLAPVAAHR
jgi:hypothetical protein